MAYFVYILRSTDDQLYIGQTENLEMREKQQLAKGAKAAKFIKDRKEFRLIYNEIYPTRLEAMRREKQLKHWTRAKKEALINGQIDKLKSLSKKNKISRNTLRSLS